VRACVRACKGVAVAKQCATKHKDQKKEKERKGEGEQQQL
jgi:hypothetical protein